MAQILISFKRVFTSFVQQNSGIVQIFILVLLVFFWIKPILCYGSEVWSTKYSNVIESVDFNFCKYFLGVNNSVNNAVAIGECGDVPLCVTYFKNCIKYLCKLLHMQNNRYPKRCYKMLKALDEAGRQNWGSKVRNLLFTYGLGISGLLKMSKLLVCSYHSLNNG